MFASFPKWLSKGVSLERATQLSIEVHNAMSLSYQLHPEGTTLSPFIRDDALREAAQARIGNEGRDEDWYRVIFAFWQ